MAVPWRPARLGLSSVWPQCLSTWSGCVELATWTLRTLGPRAGDRSRPFLKALTGHQGQVTFSMFRGRSITESLSVTGSKRRDHGPPLKGKPVEGLGAFFNLSPSFAFFRPLAKCHFFTEACHPVLNCCLPPCPALLNPSVIYSLQKVVTS